MPEEGKENPQGLDAGTSESEGKEIELTDKDIEELSKMDWSSDSTGEPEEKENTATEPEGEAEGEPKATEVEYELPGGKKITAEQITELEGFEKRYKDSQAYNTRITQENADLRQREMAQRYSQENAMPQFQPQQSFQPAPMETPYATDTERLLAERLEQVEKTQTQRDYQERQRNQRELKDKSDRLIDDFRAKHKDMTDDQIGEVLGRANQAGTYDLELAYRGMRDFDVELEQARKDAQVDLIEKLRKKQGAGLESSSQPGKETPPLDVSKMTEEQRHALMVKDLEGG